MIGVYILSRSRRRHHPPRVISRVTLITNSNKVGLPNRMWTSIDPKQTHASAYEGRGAENAVVENAGVEISARKNK